jgi:hypothetical protein
MASATVGFIACGTASPNKRDYSVTAIGGGVLSEKPTHYKRAPLME